MPIETEEIIELKAIYEPWLKPNGRLKDGAPQYAVDAYNNVSEWYANDYDI